MSVVLGSLLSLPACGPSAESTLDTTAAGPGAGERVGADPVPEAELTQSDLEALYRSSKERVLATESLPEESFREIAADLGTVANTPGDLHLRANASLLLGSLHDERGDHRAALSFFRQAQEFLPDEPSVHAMLVFSLVDMGKWEEAIAEQWVVVELAPDDLEAWLILGELHVKGGQSEEAARVYGAYELRRHGLLEGLTAKQDGEYVKDEDHRAGCAAALMPAVDNGTAIALMYALESDPSPKVRTEVGVVMGNQRLAGYLDFLRKRAASETDADTKATLTWAIEEIEADPIDTSPGPVPESIRSAVAAEEKAMAAGEAEIPSAPGAPDSEQAGEAEIPSVPGAPGPEQAPDPGTTD